MPDREGALVGIIRVTISRVLHQDFSCSDRLRPVRHWKRSHPANPPGRTERTPAQPPLRSLDTVQLSGSSPKLGIYIHRKELVRQTIRTEFDGAGDPLPENARLRNIDFNIQVTSLTVGQRKTARVNGHTDPGRKINARSSPTGATRLVGYAAFETAFRLATGISQARQIQTPGLAAAGRIGIRGIVLWSRPETGRR